MSVRGMLARETTRIRNMAHGILASQEEVSIDERKLIAFADTVVLGAWRTGRPKCAAASALRREICFGAVNYCFTHPRTGRRIRGEVNGKKVEGSKAFFACLESKIEDWNDTRRLASLPYHQWERLFPPDQVDAIWATRRRWLDFRAVARTLDGLCTSDTELYRLCRDGDSLLAFLLSTGAFGDPFLKRAQATIHRVHRQLEAATNSSVDGHCMLTSMADYRLPQLFIIDGVIKVHQKIRDHLKTKRLLRQGSLAERALRAAVVVVVQRLARELAAHEADVDEGCWNIAASRAAASDGCLPHHRTLTRAY